MHVECITVGPFQMNAYVVYEQDGGPCLLFDPGDDILRIEEFMNAHKLKPQAIYNTHAHIDHVRFAGDMQRRHELPFYLAKEEQPLLDSMRQQSAMFGLDCAEPPSVTSFLKEGQTHTFGDQTFKLLLAPGHSPGSICFLFDNFVISGDVLFYDSIGRTDLFMGDYNQLIDSIKTKLMPLDDDIIVYPGHGPQTSIGRERVHNPFIREMV